MARVTAVFHMRPIHVFTTFAMAGGVGMGGSATPGGASGVSNYTISGPSSIGVSQFGQFLVNLGSGILGADVTVTMDSGGAGGVFSPDHVILSNSNRSAVFGYSRNSAGVVVLSTSNDGNLNQIPTDGLVVTIGEPQSTGGSGLGLFF